MVSPESGVGTRVRDLIKTKPDLVETALLIALLLAAVSYWAPWVDHQAAALKLSGQDLGEFVKFIPSVARSFPRQLFYVPPFACSLCLVLLAASRGTGYPRWLRVPMLGAALLLLSGLLPPAWGHPRDLFVPEFRLQGLGVIVGLIVILGHGLLHRIHTRAMAVVVSALALLALVLPQAAFWTIRGRLWAAYQTPTICLGWGLWLHITAWLAALIGAWLMASLQETREGKAGCPQKP